MQTERLGDIASTERMKLPIYWEDLRQAGTVQRQDYVPQGVCTLLHQALRNGEYIHTKPAKFEKISSSLHFGLLSTQSWDFSHSKTEVFLMVSRV